MTRVSYRCEECVGECMISSEIDFVPPVQLDSDDIDITKGLCIWTHDTDAVWVKS